jgi:hypothetical protein
MFFTSARCRTLAEEKLAEADRDKRHRPQAPHHICRRLAFRREAIGFR